MRPDQRENAGFGHAVAIDGSWAIVGSNGNEAYVFVRKGSRWHEQAGSHRRTKRRIGSEPLSPSRATVLSWAPMVRATTRAPRTCI